MNVAIIDADLIGRKRHRFPNLACMKLSAFYKQEGNTVVLKTDYDNLNEYDKVFISKVFTDTEIPAEVLILKNITYGGTGFFFDKAPPLPTEIEHIMPDYHLYDGWINEKINQGANLKEFDDFISASIGFTTRGCIRHCSFCVNQNYNSASIHSPISEFLDPTRKRICLLDDNVFACKDWKNIFQDLQSTGKPFWFKQGMDERLLTDEKCEILFNSKWYGDYIFVFDNIKDATIIEEKLKLIRKYTNKIPKFYVFCGYNHKNPDHYNDDDFWKNDIFDIFKRIEILIKYNCIPYIMRYKDYKLSPYKGIYIEIARWCNQSNFFKKKSFREFCIANGENSSCYKRMIEFEKNYPEVKQYYDMKFSVSQVNKT